MARMDEETVPVSQAASTIANPAPLGLCGFALTTFVLSAHNAGWIAAPLIAIGLAMFYGGLAQLLAGMWEFKVGNTFGATAFTSYGAFWLAVAASVELHLITSHHAFGYFLLGWTIFTGIMFLGTLRINMALIVLFALLFVTFLLLTLGEFGMGTTVLGGYFGLATAAVAFYTAAAGLLASLPQAAFTLPVGPRS